MHQNFTESIRFYQAAYKMHPKFDGKSEARSFAGSIKIPFILILKAAVSSMITPQFQCK